MKKFAWVLGVILMALTVLAVSCAKPAAPAAPAATPPKVTSVQGTLGDVNKQTSTVTVETAQGPKPFTITPSTTLTFEDKSCTLDQLEAFQAGGGNFDCTVVYDADGNVLALNVYKVSPPASIRGTISDVNIKESTITVKTAEGDKEFHVDQTTGLLIGGDVISLALLNELLEAGLQVSPATIIYTTDEGGHAVYVDMASLPNLIQGTGIVKDVSVEKSTITITTDKGDRTFTVDAKTGQFLNNEVCSLAEVEAALEHGQFVTGCQVLFYTDKDGKLVYIDVTEQITP